MNVTTRTMTVHHHTAEIDGQEFPTTFAAHEFIDPKVEIEDDKATITYAALDEYPESPREHYSAGTMVNVRDGLGYGARNGMTIDEPDNEFAALYDLAEQVQTAAANKANEVYLVELCNCWHGHDLIDGKVPDCEQAYEALIFGMDDDTFPDGSSYGIEFPLDGYGDLESTEGVAALLLAGLDADRWTSVYSLMQAYVEAGRPEVTAFIEWSVQGYSQSDWAEGYAYMTEKDFTDPKAALEAEAEEYAAYFRGDVYLAVQETYRREGDEWVQDDYDCIGGFHGDSAIETAINEEGYF